MSTIYGSIPFFECLVRAEYTRNRRDRHGEFYPAIAHAVRCVRGHSLWFQCVFTGKHGGAAFLLPIEALVTRECPPVATPIVQPWDVFSSEFGVSQDTFTHRGVVDVQPDRVLAEYRFTVDFAGSDLSEHPEQHKALHVVHRADGLIGAYPNNRLLWHDPAFWTVTTERPDFESLAGEFRAEGVQPEPRSNIAECGRCGDRGEVDDRVCSCPAGKRYAEQLGKDIFQGRRTFE